MFSLQFRLWLMMTILFGIIYAAVVVVGQFMGLSNFYFYLGISIALMFFQYLIGPKIVEWSMGVKYVTREQNPKLYQMVEDQASRAGIPMPKVGISQMAIPNAFAFGRGISDGRVCVTKGIVSLLNDQELRAVIGHEISHLRNRDVLTITLLSIIPMILYRIAWQFLFFGNRRSSRDGANTALIGLAAFLFYFLTNLLVLYASRIREYFADKGSVELGNRPESLASALYKLVYGSARMPREAVQEAEGMKAFFVNDPSNARNEIKELSQIDYDRNGSI
ncbi:MAG TPA: zinc metalloprotease HtpX, partial [Candidatus Omnitrophota bacterium]|nr:zinc metalloprotease HtpX [Candidatus Omnitrophota bacterium]